MIFFLLGYSFVHTVTCLVLITTMLYNVPQRNLSAWQIYSSGEARKQVQKQHPGTSVKEVMCILSRKFKLLADEERAPLDVMAADDKQRYQREMVEYKRVGAYQLY